MFTQISGKLIVFITLFMVFCHSSNGNEIGGSPTSMIIGIHPQFAKPFQVWVFGYIGKPSSSASMEISVSDGIQLLDGVLRWNGHIAADSGKRMDLLLKIDKPGIYEVSAIVNANDVQDSTMKVKLPEHISMFLYCREDTIAMFREREEMERRIRDSLIYTSLQLDQMSMKRESAARRIKMLKEKVLPFTTTTSLATMAYWQMILNTDSINPYNLSDKFTAKQVKLIQHNHLLISHPHLDRIESILKADWLPPMTDEQHHNYVKLMKTQSIELYELDQRILHFTQTDTTKNLFQKRSIMLRRQIADRTAMIKAIGNYK